MTEDGGGNGSGARDPQPAIDAVLETLADDPRLVHVEHTASSAGRTATLTDALEPTLAAHVPHEQLWSHQVTAIEALRGGRSTVVATGTGSGKSLCFQIPAAEAVARGETVLMVFPTKALARDQLRSLASWRVPGLTVAAYDGDCGREERQWVRTHANVIVTNPEMLHQSILAEHARWAPFLGRLGLVVVDELHVLRGIFGTHVAHVLRRLRRLAALHGASPCCAFGSATIGNPRELAAELWSDDVVEVTEDAAPVGPRTIALWNPEAAVPEDPQHPDEVRWSVHAETALVASRLIDAGLRTLVFCRSRRSTELVAEDLRRIVLSERSHRIRSYRSGYLADERREIEGALMAGELDAVVATSALELGVDIGGLDAVVLSGYPGTTASFRQQVGRSGRNRQPSLSVLVAGQDQLDQWMMRHPDSLFRRRAERSVINPSNPSVLVPQIGCAAHELAITERDHQYWPDNLDEAVAELVRTDRAVVRSTPSGERSVAWTGRGSPAATISLRSASRGEFRIQSVDGQLIGTLDEARVASSAHPGAIYLHQGRAWRVETLDRAARTAVVRPDDGTTYTQTRSTTSIALLETDRSSIVGRSPVHLGSVEVTTQVVGYQVRSSTTHEVLDRVDLDVDPSVLTTRGVWYCFDDRLVDDADVPPGSLPGALHAAEHAAIGILPLFTICDRWDVGGVSTAFLPETGTATVVIHDAFPGGAGIAELAFDAADAHLAATLDVLRSCPCSSGCPGCVHSPKCGNGNEPLDKAAAIRLVAATLD